MIDFKIKICGITNLVDADRVLESGADAIGLNFFSKSSRFVDLQLAQAIADRVRHKAKIVGLFVNSNLEEVSAAHRGLGLDYIQLHGTESPEGWDDAGLAPIIRAIRWPARTDPEVRFIDDWTSPENQKYVAGYLVDANISGAFGGTGERTDWESLFPRPQAFLRHPLILAGGLTPQNVENAIVSTHADVVDTASGVESSPGKKDANKLKHFVDSAKSAFAKLEQRGESL